MSAIWAKDTRFSLSSSGLIKPNSNLRLNYLVNFKNSALAGFLKFCYDTSMKFTLNFNLPKFSFPQVNQVILIIIFAEFVLGAANAFILPVFALFIVKDLAAPVAVVGIAI